MFGKKVKVRPALYEKLEEAAKLIGCASVEEFAERALESEVTRVLVSAKQKATTPGSSTAASQQDVQKIADKLKGLGYLE